VSSHATVQVEEILKDSLIKNKNSAVINLRVRIASALVKYYTIQVLISEDDLLIKFNNHSLPPISVAARSKLCGSAATRLLGLRVRIPPGSWMSVSCECCVSSGRGLCDGPIPRPEESYLVWCVTVCELETSIRRGPWPGLGRSDTEEIIYSSSYIRMHEIYCEELKPEDSPSS